MRVCSFTLSLSTSRMHHMLSWLLKLQAPKLLRVRRSSHFIFAKLSHCAAVLPSPYRSLLLLFTFPVAASTTEQSSVEHKEQWSGTCEQWHLHFIWVVQSKHSPRKYWSPTSNLLSINDWISNKVPSLKPKNKEHARPHFDLIKAQASPISSHHNMLSCQTKISSEIKYNDWTVPQSISAFPDRSESSNDVLPPMYLYLSCMV